MLFLKLARALARFGPAGALVGLCVGTGLARAQPVAPDPLFGPGERVLFQGDSITDMGRGRTEDPNHILGHGYAFLIAARHGAAYAERGIVFINRGVSGDTVGRLAVRWPADTLGNRPDVLSVLIGINDIAASQEHGKPLNLAEVEALYDRLLTSAQGQNPRIKLILGEPFILPGKHNAGHWEAWQEAVRQFQAMTSRLAVRHQAALVHYQRVFDEALRRAPVSTWIWDGVHPTYAGHELMAEAWQQAYAERFIPAAPTSGANSALVPVPKLEADSYDWYARHFAVLEAQATSHPEVVLIGDSITHFWSGEPRANTRNGPLAWEDTFGGKSVLNLGFGWDRTQNVLWRLEHGEMNGLSPKVIIVNIGTNNLTGTTHARTNSPEEIAEAIGLICRMVHAKSPGSRILVMGVFPRFHSPNAPLRAAIQALDRLLPAALQGCDQVRFVDIGERFLSPDGSISPDIMADGTHPTEKGYAIWGQAIRESGILDGR